MDLQQLLKQLEQEGQQNTQQSQPEPEPQATQQSQPEPEPQATQQPQDYGVDLGALERQVQEWINIGRQVFIAKYQGNPEVLKVLPYIEEKAKALLSIDIEKEKPKSDFLTYLEMAKEEVQKELAETLKSLNNLNVPNFTQKVQTKKQEPLYTVNDYYNDYKAMLEAITDENATIRFLDGMKTPEGRIKEYGEGKKKLGEKPVLD